MTAYAQPMADPTSVVGRRIGAWVIDLIIYLALLFGAVAALGAIETESVTFDSEVNAEFACELFQDSSGGGIKGCTRSGDEVTFYEIDPGPTSAVFIGHLIAYILIQGLLGGSLGKLAVGLRVVDAQGKQAGIGRSAARTLLWVVDAITCGLPVVGGIAMVSTKGHRRVGDMAAGTYVVAKDQVGNPVHPGMGAPAAAPAGWGGPAAGVPGPGAPGGWPAAPGATPPPPPGGFGAPSPAPGFPPAAPTPPAAAPGGEGGPRWDEARNAYIQYDPQLGSWMQWSDDAGEWRPIDQ